MAAEYEELTDSQWEIISPFLNIQRKRKNSLRMVVNVLLYLGRAGVQWRNLKVCTKLKWQSVYYYYYRWSRDGTIEYINAMLNCHVRELAGRESTPSLCCVDSQSVKAAPMINEEKGLDGNKKINGRKRQVLTDTLGLIWSAYVHAANEHDSKAGCILLERATDCFYRMKKILVYAGYKGDFITKAESEFGFETEIGSRPPSEKGFVPIKTRWVIERTFGWLNFYRRLSKDFEKTTKSAESMLYLANWTICLNRIAS
ncbi:MAG: IS5 family transposase [Bacteroidota bacterium]